jgi:two-component system chemotaxis sensor kinase CheA
VHDLAGRQGKPVRFEIVGGQALFDRAVLDALLDPLMHSLTNAIDHGIEPPPARRRAGKPPTGSLRLTVDRRGDRIAIAVEDDGSGMDPDALRRAAVRLGVLSAEDAADLTDDEALLLATVPRLTTRSDADHVSGRGVGLDVVRECVERLGGYVAIRSERSRGCELRLSVPLHRALVRALLVRCAGDLYALPVERVMRSVDPERLSEAAEAGAPPRPVRLDERLGLTPRHDGLPSPGRALLLRMPQPRIALLVDEVVGRKDLVVQPLQGPLARVREYAGAAALDDGSIVVVLEPLVLVRRPLRRGASAAS